MTRYEYDGSGNLLSLTFADGTQVTYTYDALGRQTSMTDPRGNVTKYAYDGLGNLTKTTLPDGTTQTAAYTRNGQRKSVTDALENKTAYTYDGNGNQLTVTDPMGNKTVSEYDAAGRLLRETNALGGVTEYTYDQVGLPLIWLSHIPRCAGTSWHCGPFHRPPAAADSQRRCRSANLPGRGWETASGTRQIGHP